MILVNLFLRRAIREPRKAQSDVVLTKNLPFKHAA